MAASFSSWIWASCGSRPLTAELRSSGTAAYVLYSTLAAATDWGVALLRKGDAP
jgi:hypothetical protein